MGRNLTISLCATLCACSGSSATQACADYASASCNLLSSCSDGYAIPQEFGDLATCISRYQSNCDARLALPSAQSATQTEACAQALPMESCSDYYANNLPEVCRPPDGGVANGAVCTLSAQCQTAYCAIPKEQICGTCAASPGAGDDCSSLPCGPGLVCLHTTMTCGLQGGPGDGCLVEGDCRYGFACLDPFEDGGSCVPSGTLGGPCDPTHSTGVACPGRFGLYCAPIADGGACTALAGTTDGQPCGGVGGVATICQQSGICQKPPDAGQGLCLAHAEDGDPCDSVGGPLCLPLSRCVPSSDAGTVGVCEAPAAVACN